MLKILGFDEISHAEKTVAQNRGAYFVSFALLCETGMRIIFTYSCKPKSLGKDECCKDLTLPGVVEYAYNPRRGGEGRKVASWAVQ